MLTYADATQDGENKDHRAVRTAVASVQCSFPPNNGGALLDKPQPQIIATNLSLK
jgi:hypothetical protein